MASEKKMYQVIKLLLYILLNSARGGDSALVKDTVCKWQFLPPEGRFPDTLLEKPAPGRNFPSKTRNYFGNKLSGTLGSFFFSFLPSL